MSYCSYVYLLKCYERERKRERETKREREGGEADQKGEGGEREKVIV